MDGGGPVLLYYTVLMSIFLFSSAHRQITNWNLVAAKSLSVLEMGGSNVDENAEMAHAALIAALPLMAGKCLAI